MTRELGRTVRVGPAPRAGYRSALWGAGDRHFQDTWSLGDARRGRDEHHEKRACVDQDALFARSTTLAMNADLASV